MKKCSKCGIEKDEREFHKDGKKLRSDCKKCNCERVNIYKKKWYWSDPERARKYKRDNAKKNYHENAEPQKARTKRYLSKFPERRRETCSKSQKKTRARTNKWYRSKIEGLENSYIKKRLVNNGFPKEIISDDIIETKKLIIKIKRHVKEKST